MVHQTLDVAFESVSVLLNPLLYLSKFISCLEPVGIGAKAVGEALRAGQHPHLAVETNGHILEVKKKKPLHVVTIFLLLKHLLVLQNRS